MFNTSSLFKLKEKKETEDNFRLNLRIMQMLHAKLEKMDVVKQLEEKMKAGEHPSVPFLSYQHGCAWSDGDENMDILGEKVLVFEEFRVWLEDSPHRLRQHRGDLDSNNIYSIAYLFDTVLGDMDFPELPLLYNHDNSRCQGIPVRKLFNKHGGALRMLEVILGNGLQLKQSIQPYVDSKTISRKWLDDYGEESIQSQTISVSKVTWSIEFTGRPTRPWTLHPGSGLHPESTIARALAQLNEVNPKMEGFAFAWPRLLHPYWMNPHMSVEIVKDMEEGKELTEAQSHEITLTREKEDLVRPEPHEGPGLAPLCHDQVCAADGGILGAGGFCRMCSKKFYEVRDDPCPETNQRHEVYHVLSKKGTYAAIDCRGCHFHSRSMIRW
jgi:hypothetical protein